ncbi:MAG: 50S ribosomal protein L10 [Patescibacteria group bacterium]
MAKTKKQKEQAVSQMEERLSKMKSVVFTNFDGLSVSETDELRTMLRDAGIDYSVIKRSLFKIASKSLDLAHSEIDSLKGGIAVALGYGDEVLPAKTLHTFAKKHPALKLVGGIFNGRFIGAAEVASLAKLPSREELTAKLVWLIQYPAAGFVNVLAGTMRNFVYALKAIGDKKA